MVCFRAKASGKYCKHQCMTCGSSVPELYDGEIPPSKKLRCKHLSFYRSGFIKRREDGSCLRVLENANRRRTPEELRNLLLNGFLPVFLLDQRNLHRICPHWVSPLRYSCVVLEHFGIKSTDLKTSEKFKFLPEWFRDFMSSLLSNYEKTKGTVLEQNKPVYAYPSVLGGYDPELHEKAVLNPVVALVTVPQEPINYLEITSKVLDRDDYNPCKACKYFVQDIDKKDWPTPMEPIADGSEYTIKNEDGSEETLLVTKFDPQGVPYLKHFVPSKGTCSATVSDEGLFSSFLSEDEKQKTETFDFFTCEKFQPREDLCFDESKLVEMSPRVYVWAEPLPVERSFENELVYLTHSAVSADSALTEEAFKYVSEGMDSHEVVLKTRNDVDSMRLYKDFKLTCMNTYFAKAIKQNTDRMNEYFGKFEGYDDFSIQDNLGDSYTDPKTGETVIKKTY